MYTTAAYRSINNPLRRGFVGDDGAPKGCAKFPATILHITEGLSRLRAVASGSDEANVEIDLWRGFQNMHLSASFEAHGGTEMAVMSTSRDPFVALRCT